MANLSDLKNIIDAKYPDCVYTMMSKLGNSVDGITFTDTATDADKQGIYILIKSFDWNATPPDIIGFFDALGKSIVLDKSLPIDVYIGALILKDQKELKYQQVMLQILAANPDYSKEQKETLNVLLKQYGLLLPEVPTK